MAEKMAKQEQIGYHKGALTTLAKERQELGRIIGIVEQLLQFHMGALKELGVDLAKEAPELTAKPMKSSKTKPIDEIL